MKFLLPLLLLPTLIGCNSNEKTTYIGGYNIYSFRYNENSVEYSDTNINYIKYSSEYFEIDFKKDNDYICYGTFNFKIQYNRTDNTDIFGVNYIECEKIETEHYSFWLTESYGETSLEFSLGKNEIYIRKQTILYYQEIPYKFYTFYLVHDRNIRIEYFPTI